MSQGRRTSSLKASYAAVSQGVNKDLNLGSVGAAPSPLPAEPPKVPRNKKYVELGRGDSYSHCLAAMLRVKKGTRAQVDEVTEIAQERGQSANRWHKPSRRFRHTLQ